MRIARRPGFRRFNLCRPCFRRSFRTSHPACRADLWRPGFRLSFRVQRLARLPCFRLSFRTSRLLLRLGFLGCHQGGSHRREQVRIGGLDAFLVGDAQGGAEPLHQVGNVFQRPAQEHDRSLDGTSAGQSSQRLPHDGFQRAGGQVGRARPGVEQRPHVGLGEHGAARGDGVDAVGSQGQRAHVLGRGAQHEGHGVDESAGAAGAGGVHALLQSTRQVDHLRVFAAQLDDGVRLGVGALHGVGGGDHLLHERQAQKLRHADARRPRDADGPFQIAVAPGQVVQRFGKRGLDVRAMAAIQGVHQGAVLVDDHDLDGLRSCVNADAIAHEPYLPAFFSPPSYHSRGEGGGGRGMLTRQGGGSRGMRTR